MNTPFELFNVECGEGWKDLIEPLVNKTRAEGAQILQVKEKFGGLRFYVDKASPELAEMIEQAERDSYKTCEVCGKPGVPRKGGWIKTLCEEHANGREELKRLW